MRSSRLLVVAVAAGGLWLSGCAHPRPIAKTADPILKPTVIAETPVSKPTPVAERIAPAPAPPISRYPTEKEIETINNLLGRIKDAYFDYDQHFLRQDAMAVLSSDSKTLAE